MWNINRTYGNESAKNAFAVVALAVLMTLPVLAIGDSRTAEVRYKLDFSSPVILWSDDVAVTELDLHAHMQTVREEHRTQFVSSQERVGEVLEQRLLQRTGAKRALEQGLMDNAQVKASIAHEIERELSKRNRERYLDNQMLDDYTERARELYLTEPERFREAQRFSFSHVLIRTGNRGEAEAMSLILEVHELSKNGKNFDELIEEFGEDRDGTDKPGYYAEIEPGNLDQNFARVLTRMNDAGEIAGEPVRTRFGWHLIRLDKRHPRERLSWEEAATDARQLARERHRDALLKRYHSELMSLETIETVPGSIEDFQRQYGYDPKTLSGPQE